LVKAEYERKSANDELPRFRVKSTTAKLKDECVAVFKSRYHLKDEQTLKNYFDVANDETVSLQLIRRIEPDKFKALDKYLKGEPETTNERNVELLAWLIDFKHRPFFPGKDFQLTDEEKAIISTPKSPPGGTKTLPYNKPKDTIPGVRDDIKVKEKKEVSGGLFFSRPVMIFLIAFIGVGILYTIYLATNQQTGCMYWSGDQYVPIDCNEEPLGRLFLPLDPKKVKYFERITRKDTITEQSIGKIYYIKDKKQIDYYTYSGNYPQDLNRYVKRLSRYIFDKDKENRRSTQKPGS
ncbi:hypothetical protein, partial [Ferruginibacter sp. HRS2-29]